MACESELIPEYLHWNNRTTFSEADFLDDHKLYRIGNPVDVPTGTITAYSCKWSFIISEKDVLNSDDPPNPNTDFKYAVVKEVKAYSYKDEKSDGENKGFHVLSCHIIHNPIDCDYSHSEILIKHRIITTFETDVQELFSKTYTYKDWCTNKTLLQGKSAFYKGLRRQYRVDLIKLFWGDPTSN